MKCDYSLISRQMRIAPGGHEEQRQGVMQDL